jgi:divalent metal cation (Fe/Co/Zn/Cd) transporter
MLIVYVCVSKALHHRSDAFTSFVALLSILGSHAGLPILDPLGGIFVSTILLSQSSLLSYRSALTLLDASCPESTLADVRSISDDLRSDDGSRGEGWKVGNVRGISGGGGAQVEVEVRFEKGKEWKLKDAEEVGAMVKARLEEETSVREVSVPSSH